MPDDNVTVTADPSQPIDPLSGTPLSSMIEQQPPPPMPDFSSSPLSQVNAATDPELHAAAVHHWRLANLANTVGSALGGDRTLKVSQNDDGTVSLNYQPSTMGEKWGRIAQAALKGAALGFANGQGPGGPERAAAASILGGMDMPRQREQTVRQDAAVYNKEKRDESLFKANMQHMAQQNAIGAFQLDTMQKHEAEFQEDRENSLNDFIHKNNAKTYEFTDPGDLARQFNRTPEIVEAQKEGRASVHHNASGTGGKIVVVPHNKLDDFVQDDWTPMQLEYDPKTLKPSYKALTKVPGGSQTVRDRQAAEALLEGKDQETRKELAQRIEEQQRYQGESELRHAQIRHLNSQMATEDLKQKALRLGIQNMPGSQADQWTEPDPNRPHAAYVPGLVAKPDKQGNFKVAGDLIQGERQAGLMDVANTELQSLLRGINPDTGEKFDINKVLGRGLGGMTTYADLKAFGLPDTPEGRGAAALQGAVESYSRASSGVHRFRNMHAPAESEENMLQHFQGSPGAALSYLATQNRAKDSIHNAYLNQLYYGQENDLTPEQKSAGARAEKAAYDNRAKVNANTSTTIDADGNVTTQQKDPNVTIQFPGGSWTGPASKADAARAAYGGQQNQQQQAQPSGVSVPGITDYLQNLFTPRQ